MANTRVYRNMVCIERDMPGPGGKNWLACLRKAVVDTIYYWHDKMMPGHFKESATMKYGYARRGNVYQVRKKRVKGHNKPLVWTGRSEAAAKSLIAIRSLNNHGARGVMTMIPKYFYMRRRPTSAKKVAKLTHTAAYDPGPDKAAELTTITEDESQRMAAYLEKQLAFHMRQSDKVANESQEVAA